MTRRPSYLTPFLHAEWMPATAVRDRFFSIIARLAEGEESIVVTVNGKATAVML